MPIAGERKKGSTNQKKKVLNQRAKKGAPVIPVFARKGGEGWRGSHWQWKKGIFNAQGGRKKKTAKFEKKKKHKGAAFPLGRKGNGLLLKLNVDP